MTEPTRRVTITIEARHLRPLLDALNHGVHPVHYPGLDSDNEAFLLACEAQQVFKEAATAALSNEGNDIKAQLLEACESLIVALRQQARLARSLGGDIALYEGNAAAWDKARAAIEAAKEST